MERKKQTAWKRKLTVTVILAAMATASVQSPLLMVYAGDNNGNADDFAAQIAADYAQPDGLHFTVSGYEHWVDYLCRHTVYSPDNPWLPGSAYAEVTISAQQNEENAESAAESAQ